MLYRMIVFSNLELGRVIVMCDCATGVIWKREKND